MNDSRNINPFRFMAIIAVLCGAMVLPASGQQEVDPTWYSPWDPPTAAAVQPSKAQVAIHRQQKKAKVGSSTQTAAKVRAKQPTNRPNPS